MIDDRVSSPPFFNASGFYELCSIKPCYLAGWILVECYVLAYLNPNFTEKQADARDVQEIEHGVCNISSDENSDENQMWVSIIWKSIIKIVCKIESYAHCSGMNL